MTTDNITIGLDLFVGPPAGSGHLPSSPCAALRAAPRGATISALPRFVAVGQPDARDVRERGTLETACHRG